MPSIRGWKKIKNEVLGRTYDLSLAFVGDRNSRRLNRRLRRRDRPANVLSFPLGRRSGEILINPAAMRRENFSPLELFIHGLLHLKGRRHGSRMEREEKKLIARFTTHGSSPRRRT